MKYEVGQKIIITSRCDPHGEIVTISNTDNYFLKTSCVNQDDEGWHCLSPHEYADAKLAEESDGKMYRYVSPADFSGGIQYNPHPGYQFVFGNEEYLANWNDTSTNKSEEERSVNRTMTHKFHEGDKAIMHEACGSGTPSGSIGVFDGNEFTPAPESPSKGWGCSDLAYWELISCVENDMDTLNKLTKEQELAFSKEQQALYKVGITDSYGNVNSTTMIKALFRLNHKALVAQAEADIKELEDAEKAKKVK